MMILWFDFKKPLPRWRGQKEKREQEGEKTEKRKGGRGKEERNEAGLDSQRLAAVLLTIWVTPAAVFLRGEQKHLICHSFHFHSNTCKSFAFCQFYLFLSFLHMPLHSLNDNAVAISSAVHRPVHSVTCIQSCETANSLLQTCWFFFHFFFPPEILQPFTHSPTTPIRFPPATYPPSVSWSNPDLGYATLTRPRTAQWLPRGPLFRSYVSPLDGNKWTSCSIATMISCHRWERGTREPLLFCARYIQKSKYFHEFEM